MDVCHMSPLLTEQTNKRQNQNESFNIFPFTPLMESLEFYELAFMLNVPLQSKLVQLTCDNVFGNKMH